MFPVIFRVAAGLAIGAAAALAWRAQRRQVDSRAQDAPIDDAIEDTFPASDPPAFMQSLTAGAPAHNGPRDEETEAHPS
jgi:hypothetical protein